jgi:UPF0755 protein
MQNCRKITCFIIVFLIILSAIAIFFTFSVYKKTHYIPIKNVIVEDTSDSYVSNLLVREKLADNLFFATSIVKIMKLMGYVSKFGEYTLPISVSTIEAIKIFSSGKVVIHKITIPEGLSVFHTLERIEKNEFLLGKIEQIPEEGSLMPDTYCFKYPTMKQQIIFMAQSAMQEFLRREWNRKSPLCTLKTPRQALILASIVEKETNIEKEMVAGVYLHRLQIGMKLQSCPTVIYAIKKGGKLDHELKYSDLRFRSPYNTYIVDGLPPSPITNPGKLSIFSVLHPKKTKNLFFVSDGTKKHVFSKTFAEHKQNIAKIRNIDISKIK